MAKRSDTEEEGNENKECGYFTTGITNWRPKGTGPPGAWEGTGSGGLGGQTDRQMPMAAQGRTRRGCDYLRWTQVQHKERLSGCLYHPALDRLPNTVASSHTHGGQSCTKLPVVIPGALFTGLCSRTGRIPPAEQLQAEELQEGPRCTSRALHAGGER